MSATIGSWRFLIIQSIILAIWILLNVTELVIRPWDVYPFILLNLALSFQAAYTGPILLIASNRQSEIDRLHAEVSYSHTDQLLELQQEQMTILHSQNDLMTDVHQLLHAAGVTLRTPEPGP